MQQLAAVYPELGSKHVWANQELPAPDGSIKRVVKPLDFDAMMDEAAPPVNAADAVGERGMRDATASPADPANKGMLSWLGFGNDQKRGLVSSVSVAFG